MKLGQPLAGRDRELADITAGLRRGRVAGAVLHGEAGVGKTRLLAELVAASQRRNEPAVLLRCSSGTVDLPLGMLAPVLSADVHQNAQPMLVEARDQLLALGKGKRLLVAVDDVQLADDASAQLLARLVETDAISLLGTYRRGEYVPNPIAELWHRGLIDQVEVRPLDKAACTAMANGVIDGTLDSYSADRVFALTHGNPLHVSVLLRGAAEAGLLKQKSDGAWHLTGDLAAAPVLVDFVEAQIGRLEPQLSRALSVVALAEPIGVAEVEALADLEALAELEDQGFVTIAQDGRRSVVRMGHPLFAEILRARTSRARARLIYRELAQLVEKHGARRREDLLRVAVWALEGGLELSSDRLTAAGVVADLAHDYALAERLARTSFDQSPTFEAGQVLCDVYFHWGRLDDVLEVVAVMESLAETEAERTIVEVTRSSNKFWKGADGSAEAALAACLDHFTDENCRAELIAMRATILSSSGRAQEALDIAGPVLSVPNPRAIIYSLMAYTMGLKTLGRALEGVAVADEAWARIKVMAPQLNVVHAPVILISRDSAANDLGRFAEAEAHEVELRHELRASQDEGNLALCDLTLAYALAGQGRFHAALDLLDEAIEITHQQRHHGHQRWMLMAKGVYASQAGLVDVARAAVSRLEALGPHPAEIFEAWATRARAWLAFVEHRVEDARALTMAAADDAGRRQDRSSEILSLYDLVRMGDPATAAARLAEVVTPESGPFFQLLADHAIAAARNDPDALAAVAVRLAETDAYLFASHAAAAAAAEYARRGNQRAAAQQALKAEQHVARCDVASTGMVVQSGPAPLTRREQEIAQLAAAGLSSREIGERTFLSVRTVDNHLGRVYDKLHVRNRVELAEALAGVTAS